MVDLSEFESISPYTDAEAAEALSKLAEFPLLSAISQKVFPSEEPDYLKNTLKSIKTIDEFQILVMQKFVRWVIETTAKNFSYDSIANIDPNKKFLALSNHRDIILDPAITQLVLHINGIPMTEIAVGDNLISNEAIEWLIRSNRMIKVTRGVSEELDAEALKVVSASPKWKPGRVDGEKVRTSMTIPVEFRLEKKGAKPSFGIKK